jgi:plastocyanin
VLGALSTGHEVGLAVAGGVFIAFALASSFLAPRRWPDFPGQHGLSVFIIATIALFAVMITSVAIFGREKAEGASSEGAETGKTIEVSETEYRIKLPPSSKLAPGEYTFVVTNDGQVQHDLVISGGHATGQTRTPLLDPGKTVRLKVSLDQGIYTLYCSVDSHRQEGMSARLAVG